MIKTTETNNKTKMVLNVVDADGFNIGFIAPQVGMLLACGSKIGKVNTSSMTIEFENENNKQEMKFKIKSILQAIDIKEAKKYGFMFMASEDIAITNNLIEKIQIYINSLVSKIKTDEEQCNCGFCNSDTSITIINIQKTLQRLKFLYKQGTENARSLITDIDNLLFLSVDLASFTDNDTININDKVLDLLEKNFVIFSRKINQLC